MQTQGNIVKISICFIVMVALLIASYMMFVKTDAPAHFKAGAEISSSLNTTLKKVTNTTTAKAAHHVPQK